MTIFSFQLRGEFAFFKKNDANDLVYVSYNFIHRPAVLGMLGAILGLPGYTKTGDIPEYYRRLNELKIGIAPGYQKPLPKFITVFNNSSGLGSNEKGAWQVREQILMGEPDIVYTVFIVDDPAYDPATRDLLNTLRTYLQKGLSTYPLYFGKNEFFAYHSNYVEYHAASCDGGEYLVNSLMKSSDITRDNEEEEFDFFNPAAVKGYSLYERLPVDFDDNFFYHKALFLLTDIPVVVKENRGFYAVTDAKGASFCVQCI